MTPDLIAAAIHLASLLERENAALTALDFPRAVQMLEDKRRATEAFTAAQSVAASAAASGSTLAPGQPRAIHDLAERLRVLADENKWLLERAMAVQGRVIGTIARAVPRVAQANPRYGAGGTVNAPRRLPPMALSARV